MRSGFVDYVTFVRTIDEAFTQAELERAPLIIPIPHYPSEANPRSFLNFEERHKVAVALEKLASVGDRNLEELFSVSFSFFYFFFQTPFLKIIMIKSLNKEFFFSF